MTTTIISKSSSNISRLDYDEETRTLVVTFRSSGIYAYDGVPPEKFAEAVKVHGDGGSVGRWFQSSIRGHFEMTRVPETAREPINTLAAG